MQRSRVACPEAMSGYGWGRRMAPQVATEPTTRSQNGNMLRPGIASAINPGRITHFRPSRRNRNRAVTRSTAHWTGGAMTSQKDKPSEIAATANAAAKRFLSAAPNRHLLYPRLRLTESVRIGPASEILNSRCQRDLRSAAEADIDHWLWNVRFGS